MIRIDRQKLSNVMCLTTDPNPDAGSPNCHVCGRVSKLTLEHVPPESAFNNCSSLFERLMKPKGAKDSALAVRIRGGFRVRTLCADCNNRVCSPYAEAYVNFVRHLVEAPRLFAPYGGGRLLRVPCDTLLLAKEIATMILAIEPFGTANIQSSLRPFVMNPEATCDPPFQVWAFLVPEAPEVGTITRFHARMDTFAPGYRFFGGEISWFPFGFVYGREIGQGYLPETLTDITHWFRRDRREDRFNEHVSLHCRMSGVESIQCAVGRQRVRPQIDYVG